MDSFVEFDRTIVKRDVVAELKRIAGKPEDDIDDEEEVDHLYQEATMPLEDVIAKYEAKESLDDEIQRRESPLAPNSLTRLLVSESESIETKSEDSGISKPKMLKNPNITALAGSSGSKGISPFLRAKAPTKDKNSESDVSVAKEIDFNQEGEIKFEITNGMAPEDQIQSEESGKKEDSIKNEIKPKTNGENMVHSTNSQDNLVSDKLEAGKENMVSSDKGDIIKENEAKPTIASLSNGEVNISTINHSKLTNDCPNDSNGIHAENKVK